MTSSKAAEYIAFDRTRRLASGALTEVARAARALRARDAHAQIVIFEAETSERVELDLRASADAEGPKPVDEAARAGAGRPKLGVVAREVNLLPRHWDWLASQPGGASAALRRLVEDAKRGSVAWDRARRARSAVEQFMSAMTGDLPNFEEASRAFYRQDRARFDRLIADWPPDLRDHLARLVTAAVEAETAAPDFKR